MTTYKRKNDGLSLQMLRRTGKKQDRRTILPDQPRQRGILHGGDPQKRIQPDSLGFEFIFILDRLPVRRKLENGGRFEPFRMPECAFPFRQHDFSGEFGFPAEDALIQFLAVTANTSGVKISCLIKQFFSLGGSCQSGRVRKSRTSMMKEYATPAAAP